MDFSSYFTQLSVGCVALCPLVPWRAVGKGYMVMMLTLGLALLPVGWIFRVSLPPEAGPAWGAWSPQAWFAAYGLLSLVGLALFLVGPGAPAAAFTRVAGHLGVVAVILDAFHAARFGKGAPLPGALLAFNFLSSTYLLGSALSAMLLGHWYLVVKDLPVEPLKRLTILFFVALAARLLATVLAFAHDPAAGRAVADRSFLFVLVFGLFSLGSPIAMSWMVWGTVRIRSTQAATGILYGVVAFLLMGEAAGRFVLIRTGFPL